MRRLERESDKGASILPFIVRGSAIARPINCTQRLRCHARLTPSQVRRYLTMVRTTISSKGQLVLPAEIRAQDGIEAGQEFEIERLDRGTYRLIRRTPENEGVLTWLLSCPDKGYFVPIDSESTDTL